MSGGAAAGRRGSALVLVVLALVALELLAHGALLLARQERLAALAGLRVVQARSAAEAALARLAGGGLPEGLDTVPLLGFAAAGAGTAGPHPSEGGLRRLSREVWLVQGVGGAAGAGWRLRVGTLLWLLDPASRAGESPAAVLTPRVDGPLPAGAVQGAAFRARDAPTWCAPWAEPLDSLLPAVSSAVGDPLPKGGAWPTVGWWGVEPLASHLASAPSGSVTPEPAVSEGRCDDAPTNWGDPVEPEGPCGGVLVGVFVTGDLVVEGGRGQGLLVVDGRVALTGGAVFHGLVVASGDVVVDGGAGVVGQLRAGGGFRIAAGSRVLASPCHVARALAAARPLVRTPLRLPLAGVMTLP